MTKSTNSYLHFRVTENLAIAAKLAAEENGCNLSHIMRQALEEFLQKKGYRVRSS